VRLSCHRPSALGRIVEHDDDEGMVPLNDAQIWTMIGAFTALMFGTLTVVSTLFVRVVRAEIGSVRTEIGNVKDTLRSEIGSVRDTLRSEIGTVRDSLRSEIGSVRTEVGSLRAEMNTRFEATDRRVEGLDRDVRALMKRAFDLG